MTTVPMSTPQTLTAQPRPVAPQGAPMGQLSTIDPLKLLNRHKWLLAASAVAGSVIGVGAHFALLFLYPQWRPFALFNVMPPQERLGDSAVGVMNAEEMNRFMQTQVRVMVSDAVLTRVVEDPAFRREAPKWSSYYFATDKATGEKRFDTIEAARDLKDYVGAKVLPQTSLIELSMTYTQKLDATAIVALIERKYIATLKEQGTVLSEDRTRSFRDALDRIDADIKSLSSKREGIIQKDNVELIDGTADSIKMAQVQVNEQLTKVQTSLQGLTKQKEQMESEASQGKYGDDLLAEVEKDPAVLDIRNQISRLETEQQSFLNKGMSREHRNFKELEANLQGARDNLDRVKAERLKNLFAGNLDSLRKAIAQYTQEEAKLSQTRSDNARRLTDLGRIQAQLKDIESQITGLMETKAKYNDALQNQLGLQSLSSSNRVVLLQEPRVPSELAFPKLKLMIPAGMVLCVGLVGGIVLLREMVDQRIKGPSDITIIPRTKLLGWVPDAAEDPAGQGAAETAFRDRPKGIIAESYRLIRSTIAKRVQVADHKTILVLAGMPGSGATSAVANLAFAFATADRRVLVIDANFRRPTLHRVLGLQEGPGLAEVLARGSELTDVVQATSTPNLDLLSAGSKEQRVYERLASEAMGELLTRARLSYDLVLIDVAPAIVAGDGVSLAQRCDASILVVKALAEKRGMVARIKNELIDGRGEFLGVIVNGVRASSGGYMKGNIKAAHEYQQA